MSTPLHNAIDQIRTPGGIAGGIRREVDALEARCDDARSCARYLLSFLVNEPHYLAVALKRWPWLENVEAPE